MEAESSKWFLVYTKAREEKLAKKNLENQGFETILPMMAKNNMNESNPLSLEVIFPRYIFSKVNLASDNWISINSTKGVSHLVVFGNQLAIIPNKTIESLRAKLDEDNIFYPKVQHPAHKKGEKVIIKKGKLAGFEAIFLSEISTERVKLLLKYLKTTITVDISKFDLDRKYIIEEFEV